MESNKACCIFAVDEKSGKFIALYDQNRGYNLPGGKVELGETFSRAAVREFKEETGIEVPEQDLIPLYIGTDTSYQDKKVGTYWVVTYLYFIDSVPIKLNSPEGLNISLQPIEILAKTNVWDVYNISLLANYRKLSHLRA